MQISAKGDDGFGGQRTPPFNFAALPGAFFELTTGLLALGFLLSFGLPLFTRAAPYRE